MLTDKPLFHIGANGVTVSVFSRKQKINEIEKTFYSCSFSKSYFKDGKTNYSKSFDQKDLLILSSLAERAYWKINDLRFVKSETSEEVPE